MKTCKISDMIGGWFVGNFTPTAHNADFEVCYKFHEAGEQWDAHYHKLATEINVLLEGEMTINGQLIRGGDIFVIEPYEVSIPKFKTDCRLIVVKTISDPNDKYGVEV